MNHDRELLASRKARAEIYRKAALRVVEDRFYASCCAINEAACGNVNVYSKFSKEYSRLFSPSSGWHYYSPWGSQWGYEAQACRILALLFMAAMVEAGDA